MMAMPFKRRGHWRERAWRDRRGVCFLGKEAVLISMRPAQQERKETLPNTKIRATAPATAPLTNANSAHDLIFVERRGPQKIEID